MAHVTPFETFLREHDGSAWAKIVTNLLSDIHPVDRRATEIWFAFWPYELWHALDTAADPAVKARDLLLGGKYRLADHVDTSHEFFYGHRFWKDAKEAVIADAKNGRRTTLEQHIRQAAKTLKTDTSIALGITAVAYMTLHQVGWERFSQPAPAPRVDSRSPETVLKERAKAERGGFFSFLRTVDQRFTVCFNENDPAATFKAINLEMLTMAGTRDKRDYASKDPRCVEGPIPIECQTGACGTCWVGILGGNENVSEITPFEVKRLEKIGYPYNGESRPPIRLACKTACQGPVSIVIPPWNGVLEPLYREKKETARSAGGQA